MQCFGRGPALPKRLMVHTNSSSHLIFQPNEKKKAAQKIPRVEDKVTGDGSGFEIKNRSTSLSKLGQGLCSPLRIGGETTASAYRHSIPRMFIYRLRHYCMRTSIQGNIFTPHDVGRTGCCPQSRSLAVPIKCCTPRTNRSSTDRSSSRYFGAYTVLICEIYVI